MLVRRQGGPRGIFETYSSLDQIRQEMDRLASTLMGREGRALTAGVFPPMNVTQDPDTFFLRVELPGIDPKELEIAAVRNKITISGARKLPEENEDVSYHRREREGGRFSRSLTLPTEVDAERVQANYEHGVLTMTLPKSEAAKPKQITVKAG